MTVSTTALESTSKPLESEELLAAPKPARSDSTLLLTGARLLSKPRHSRHIMCKSLNLRVGPERYQWFHRIRQRLGRPTNEKTLESLLAITQLYLDSKQKPKNPWQGMDLWGLLMVEVKRRNRASNRERRLIDIWRLLELEREKEKAEAASRINEVTPETFLQEG